MGFFSNRELQYLVISVAIAFVSVHLRPVRAGFCVSDQSASKVSRIHWAAPFGFHGL